MNSKQIVNIALLILAMIGVAFADETKKSDRFMVIDEAKLPSALVRNTESIQQVLTRSVLFSKQFELIFTNPEQISDTKLRVYQLQTQISATDRDGFFDIAMDLRNPKLNKSVKAEKETYIQGKRLLHTLRIMVLRMIFGEAFIRKNKLKIEKISAEDPALQIPPPTPEKKVNPLPPVKKVAPLEDKKKNYDEVSPEKEKKPSDPSSDKDPPVFRDRKYALGLYYQNQQISSAGYLLDVDNNFSAVLLDFQSNTLFDKEGDNILVLSGRYGKSLSSYETKIPDSIQATSLFDRHLISGYRGLAGFRLEKTSFANLPQLNAGIQTGEVTSFWGQLGLEKQYTLFNHRVLVNGSLIKMLHSKLDYPMVGEASVSGQGMVLFLAAEIIRRYFLAFEISQYGIDIAGNNSSFMNSDRRFSLGLFYPLGDKK